MSQRFYVETLGLPEEPGRLRQAGRHVARRRACSRPPSPRTPTSSSSTPAPSSRPPGRSRSTRCWRSPSVAGTAPASSSPAAWPSATATSSPTRCPRSTRSPASASGSTPRPAAPRRTLIPVRAVEVPDLDLLNLPRPAFVEPVGVRQDRRGLRPRVRVLRHPVVPRSAAQPVRASRSSPRSTSCGRGRSCSSPRTWPRTARTFPTSSAPASIVPLVRAVADRVDRVRLLYLYPSDLTDALIDAVCDSGVPYFDLSLQHVSKPLLRRMRRWGDGDRFLRAHRRHPPSGARRGLPQQLHRRLPRRDRAATTTSCCASSRRPSSTGAGSSPSAGRTAPTPPTSTARCRAGWWPSASAS